MNDEKFKFYLVKIEQKFPNKTKLNQGEMLQCICKSRATFSRIIEKNELHKIPKISSKEKYTRLNSNYYKYEFDLYNIAKFMAGGE